jgi:undecaprenyl-diphosphatase
MLISNLLKMDAEFSHKLQNQEFHPLIRKAMSLLAHSADSWYWGAGLAILWLLGPPEWRGLIQLLLLGIILTALFVQGLKFIIKRPRPEGEWGQIYRNSDPHSFPSGHAARSIMLTILILLSGYIWLGFLMILWTILVGISRIGLGVHYISDVLVGSLIGALFGGLMFLIWG